MIDGNEMAMISHSDLNSLHETRQESSRRPRPAPGQLASPCGHTAPQHGRLLSRTIKEAKRRRHVQCPGAPPRPASKESEERTEQQSRSKGREPKQLELVTLTHVGKAAPPPSPMRGPTKARQICFELAKTKSKEQSYQEATEIDGERD
jgi:hypothetical protein